MLTGLFLRFNARCFGAPPFISLSLMDRIPILKQALYSWIKRQCGNQASVSFSRLTSARHVQTGWTSMLKLTIRSITRVGGSPCYISTSLQYQSLPYLSPISSSCHCKIRNSRPNRLCKSLKRKPLLPLFPLKLLVSLPSRVDVNFLRAHSLSCQS